ncbi:MAG: RNA polymerase factor sigma-54 [Spirochaetes bacterium]|nr:RNA polymerase factor sigma-54 [Spirochaetota bacterium]
MAISLHTGLKQNQKTVMTQSLKQAIELLQLSTVELYERISKELEENPVLEEDAQAELSENDRDPAVIEDVARNLSGDESLLDIRDERRSNFADSSDAGFPGEGDDDRQRNYLEHVVTREESLAEHLLWQARLTARDEGELSIYETIITSLDENGFLSADTEKLLGRKLEDDAVKNVISSIRLFDPVGCAVTGVSDSLAVQCRHFYPDDGVLVRMVTECFAQFEKLDYKKISEMLNIPLPSVLEKSRILQGLDPYPGRQYSNRIVRYIMPDVDVRLVDGEIIVSLNDDWIPGIHINSYYISLIKKKNIEKKLKDYIQDKMQSARYLVKNISNRRNTILRVVGSIMEHQREFLVRGPGHLKPLTHGEVAREVSMHESTVSRVTSNKYVQTPWGVFDLKYFFVSRIKSSAGNDDASSDAAMNIIRDIIDREDPERPCSDEEIVRIAGKAGIGVARRTVAKYRAILGIPPSNKRKKINKIKSEEGT